MYIYSNRWTHHATGRLCLHIKLNQSKTCQDSYSENLHSGLGSAVQTASHPPRGKNTHLNKSLLSRFQLPYPLLKMSFADFPRSTYAGGTAIVPVEGVERWETRIRDQQERRTGILLGIRFYNTALKYCTFAIIQVRSWHRSYMSHCDPQRGFVMGWVSIIKFIMKLDIFNVMVDEDKDTLNGPKCVIM